MKRNSEYWIDKLKLTPHPEGGYFREIYRSEEKILKLHLPGRFYGDRNFSTSIFYLLSDKEFSRFHKIKSDELWHFYSGECLVIYEIDREGKLIENKLGLQIENGESPQIIIKAGNWFAAKLQTDSGYCLAGCTVSPGFHFEDLEMADRKKLIELFPEHKNVITNLT